ncbi:MAG: EamA family transporter [Angelakisella sp.]
MWAIYAFGAAIFAALTSILAKLGMAGINSNLATAIRTIVVLVMAWGMVFITGAQTGIKSLTQRDITFLVLSGVATGLSWLCYYYAIQIGQVQKVVAIDKFSIVITLILAVCILKEPMTTKTVVGGLLITAGTYVMIM